MNRPRILAGPLLAGVLLLVTASPALANRDALTIVASGLDNPRGLGIGIAGTVYVAEAGRGGDGPQEEQDAVNAIRAKRGEKPLPSSGESRPNAPNGANGKHEDSNSPPEVEAVAPQSKPATPMIRQPRGKRSKVAVL